VSRATPFAAATRVGFGVLGPLEVRDGETLVHVPGRQERALLALLLTAPGRVFSVASIVEALWGDDPPGRAAKSVQSYVFRLRQALPRNGTEVVVTRSPGYMAVVEPDQVDAEHFKGLVVAGRRVLAEGRPDEAATLLREALGLWRGEPYAEFDEPFAVAERTALEELRTTALEDRIEAELRTGAGAELVAELEALTARHPWRERLWVQLMVALFRARRQADALDAYRRARRVLGEELGLEPGPELRETEARVLAQDQSLLGTQPVSEDVLPPAGPTFVGRETELARLLASYGEAAAGTVVRILLTGPHGIGKSRLLGELAQQAQSRGAAVRLGPSTPWPASMHRPLVLLLDDLHRAASADLATLAEHIVAARPPLLVVGAAVLSEAPPDVRAVLCRAFPDQLSLPPLPAAAVEAIIRVYVGPDDVADALAAVADADGVPLQVHAAASRYGEERAVTDVEEAAAGIPEPRRHLTASRDRVTDRVLDLQRIRLLREAHAPTEQPYVVCPYKGLAHYEPDDAPYYAGRERLVAQLVARVVDARMLAVVGASGSGKSSAVGAGLIAAVRAGSLPGSDAWLTVLTRPTRPRPDPTPEGTRALVVVDQLEELFTAIDGADRDEYVEWLASEAERPGTTVVVVVRSDYFAMAAAERRLAPLLADDTVIVGEMTPEELRQAIERPAAAAGRELEPGLVDRVLADAGDEPGALPLVSTALVSLWERRDGRRLTLAAYAEIGGVHSSIARLAESAYGRMTPEQQVVARRILLRLAATGEAGEPVRRRVPLDEVARDGAAHARDVLDVLAAARLVTVSDAHAEVAHEALLRAWPRLAEWLAEDEEGRRVRQHLSPAALDWAARGREPDELYRGPRLATALAWETDHPDDLTSLERDFLNASRDAADAEALRRRQSIRRLRGLAVGLAAVLVLAVTAGVVAVDLRNDALTASLAADVRALQAEALDEERWDRALLYAVEAHLLGPSPATRGTLLQTVMRAPEAISVLGTDQPLMSVAVSGDGRRVVAGGANGSVFVWDRDGDAWSAREVEDVVAFFPESLDVSPDGRYVATVQVPVPVYERGSFAWYVTLVDLEADPPAVRYLDYGEATAARFASDGRTVVAVDAATATASLVDVESGDIRGTFDLGVADPGENLLLQQSADRRLVTASFLGAPSSHVAFEAVSGRTVWRSVEPAGAEAAISPDGSRVALSHGDGRVEVVDVVTGEGTELEMPGEVRAPAALEDDWRGGVGSLEWSPDGFSVLGTTVDRAVLLWDAETGALRSRLGGHWGDVSDAVFSADGTTVYASGQDRAALAWDLTGRRGVIRDVPTGPGARLRGGFLSVTATMTPDGRIVATALEDDVVRVVDTTRAEEFEVSARAPAAHIEWLSVDEDGRYVLVHLLPDDDIPNFHVTISVLDVEARELLPTTLSLRPRGGWEAVTTADVTGILTAEGDLLRLWDLSTGDLVVDNLYRAKGSVGGIVVSPDGRLAVLNNGEVVDVTTGERAADLDIDQFDEVIGLGTMAFSADGRWFAGSLASGRVVVWDTRTWAAPRVWDVASGLGVDTLVFTPDSASLIAGLAGTAAVLSLEDEGGQPVRFAVSSTRPDSRLRLGTPDGRTLVSLDESGTIREWTIDPARLLAHACSVVARDLTQEEWEAVLPDRPYERTCPVGAASAAPMAR
jgi:DNA-binding SARP family transcriptional activator/WD40 repeat protein